MDYASLKFRFPTGGVVKRAAYQEQPANTASAALNVWPDDTSEGRERGGSRPGMSRIEGEIPTISPVRCMLSVNKASTNVYDREILAVVGDRLWRRSSAGVWAVQSGTFATSSGQMHAAQYGTTVYFVDGTGYRKLDLTGSTLGSWSASNGGTLPTGATLIASWHDRIVLAGTPSAPQVWYMSAAGDPLNFEYGVDIATSAVSGAQFEGGLIAEPITCIIPHSRKCILFGTSDGCWIMRGDPIYERGSIEVLSHEIGPVTGSSWCKTPNEETVMLTRDGVYAMPAGCGQTPTSFSRERLPEDLVNIDVSENTILMSYDTTLRGVHIWITPSTGVGSHWLLDWDNGGFWPLATSEDIQPSALCNYTPLATADVSPVVLGGLDGQFRSFDRTAFDDDGTAFDSYLVQGPFSIAGELDQAGIISEANFLSQARSGTHRFKIYSGDTAELATDAQRSYTCSSPFRGYPRLQGQSACVRVEAYGEAASSWLTEGGLLRVAPAGRMRR